jgi:antitoxin YefM
MNRVWIFAALNPSRFCPRYASKIKLDKTYAMAYHWNVKIPLHQVKIMPTLTATEARSKLYRLVDEAASTHEPIVIKGKRGSAVLISEDDWRAIQETMYLLNIPGMRESIREGLATPIEECTQGLDW